MDGVSWFRYGKMTSGTILVVLRMNEKRHLESHLADDKAMKKICLAEGIKSTDENTCGENNDRLVPVLNEEFTSDVSTCQVYVASVIDQKNMSRYIREIYASLPFPCLQHLKRVRNKDIIICPAEIDGGYPEKVLKEKGITGLSNVHIEDVSITCPRTKKQLDQANKLWPIKQFNEDRDLEKKLAGTFFSDDEVLNQKRFMTVAIEAAKRSKFKIGAVVTDPKTNEILAVASDNRLSHPMKHATMVAIDLIARAQGGGVWNVEPPDYFSGSDINKIDFPHKKRNHERDPDDVVDGPYLCTGYDLYITSEPCTMCAMALLHSRIFRVFYGCSMKYGAFGTIAKVHSLKDTNHRFEVFRGLLKTECSRLK